MNSIVANYVVPIALPVGIGIIVMLFMRIFPKGKLIDHGTKWGFAHGKIVSRIGNSRLGKKAMEDLEEGPIVTLVAGAMAYLTNFAKGALDDNQNRERSGLS